MSETLALFDADLTPAEGAIDAPERAVSPRSGSASSPSGRLAAEPVDARPRLLAVDGNALVHRAFHAYGGTAGGARYGFFALLSVVCDQQSHDGLVIGFDCRQHSQRRDRYPHYKAQRPDKHEQLEVSLDELPGIAGDMGAHVVVASGLEADDVVASAVSVAEAAGWRCTVASPDRDMLALVSDATDVLQVRGGAQPIRRVTVRDFGRKWRIRPEQYLQLAALRGDASDNLGGITGVGAKKAAALLRLYDTVEDAVADPIGCRSVLGPELGQALIDDLATADSVFRRNIELMTLRRDVLIELEATYPNAAPDDILAVLRQHRMTGLHARMCAAMCPRTDDAPPVGDADAPPEPGLAWEPEPEWNPAAAWDPEDPELDAPFDEPPPTA